MTLRATIVDEVLRDDEQVGPPRVSDARRWIEILERLIELKQELIERAAAAGLEPDDVGRQELERLQERLSVWQQRHAELAPVDLDDRLGIVTSSGEVIPLTRRERELLRFLIQHAGHHFDARTLAARAWNDSSLAAEQVRTYVVRLRRLLRLSGVRCEIHSQRRRGYMLVFTPAAA